MAGDWREVTLGEITENFDGRRVPVKEADRRPGPYPYYGASGIVDYVDNYLFDGEYLLIAEDGENLRTRSTPVAFLARGKFWVNNHAHIVRGNGRSDTRYLMYALAAVDIGGYLTGSAMPKLTQGHMNRIELLIPERTEQRAIAHILGTLDDRIEANRRMAATLEEMARALFRAWFVTFEPVRAKAEGRWRPGQTLPGLPARLYDAFPDRLVETKHGEIPEGWRHSRLGDFTELQNGYAFKSTEWQTAGTPVVKIGSVKPSVVDLKQVSFVTQTLANDRSAFQLKVGDVLVGLTGYVGETGRVPPTANPPMLNQRVGRFSSSGTFSPFVYACVSQPEFKQYAESKAHGSAQPNVSTKDLLDYPVTASNNVVLRSFEGLVAPIFQKSLANFGEIAALSETRDFLLPRLMSGEVRVKDAEAFLKARGL